MKITSISFPENYQRLQDKAQISRAVETHFQYTFKMKSMAPTKATSGGEVRIVDSRNFPVSKHIVGYVPDVAGHYVENTEDTDLIFLELFASDLFQDVSLNNWLRHLPAGMVAQHLNLNASSIKNPGRKAKSPKITALIQ